MPRREAPYEALHRRRAFTHRSLGRTAAILSAVAAAIHAAEAPQHFTEWWGYGAFFVVAAAAQAVLAILLAIGLPSARASASAPTALGRSLTAGRIVRAGVAGNAAIVGLYVWTRTIGVPLIGPEAGEIESLNRSGVVATAIELLLVGVLVALDRRASQPHTLASTTSPDLRNTPATPVSVASVVPAALATFLVLASVAALPAVIAQQEGGSGPGSALLLGQAVQAAAAVIGAAAVGAVLSRQPWAPVFTAAALVHALAIGAIPLAEHAAASWIVVTHIVSGLSVGAMLTGGFSLAASVPHSRLVALGLMLITPSAARLTIGLVERGGLLVLGIGAIATLTVAWWIDRGPTQVATDDRSARSFPDLAAATGLVVAATGVLGILASADPTGLLATMLAGPAAMPSIDAIGILRLGFLITGLALLAAGSAALVAHAALVGRDLLPVTAIGFATLVVTGVTALLVIGSPPSGVMPGERTLTPVGLGSVAGAAAGIGLASLWGAESRRLARLGLLGALLLCGAAIGTVLAADVLVHGRGDASLATAIGGAGAAGAGMALTFLWRRISDGRRFQRVRAIAAGIAAVSIGGALGNALARNAVFGLADGQPSFASILLGVAAVGVVAAIMLCQPFNSSAAEDGPFG